MKTKTRKKSAGRKAPAKKAAGKKKSGKKTAAKKKTAKKASGAKSAGRKASGSGAPAETPARDTNGAALERRESEEPHDAGLGEWGELINRVRDVVDPYAADAMPASPRIQDAQPVGRWIAASFLAGCLVGWILASIL